jgi:hypothetical protein
MPRYFNTAGPCEPDRHYLAPPLPRFPGARRLIDQQGYFVLQAPRQTGKTTTLRALAKALTAEGRYAALQFTCEEASVAGDDHGAAMTAILFALRAAAAQRLPAELQPPPFPEVSNERRLGAALTAWAEACPRPLVLFFDEIDSLHGDAVTGVLRQLRAGFPERPAHFPWSVILCGMRDVRDYKLASGGNAPRLGSASPFNIEVESSRLGDFSEGEVRTLYAPLARGAGDLRSAPGKARHRASLRGDPYTFRAAGKAAEGLIQ